MNKKELEEFLKKNLKIKAGRHPGYISMGGPQDGESAPGEIYIELWLGNTKLNSVTVENW